MAKKEKEPVKLVFAPGCFDNFEGTQEELDELIVQITEMFAGDEWEGKAVPIDLNEVLNSFSEEELEEIQEEENQNVEKLSSRKLH